MQRATFTILATATLLASPVSGWAQNTPPAVPMKKAGDLLKKQDPPIVNTALAATITPENSRIIISIAKQRAFLMVGDEIYIDTPVSTGKRAGMTPMGTFTIQEKERDHRSSLYGEFVDRRGRTVRSGVSLKVDSAPSGTHYVGAPMKWFSRFSGAIGMHVGILPGYPASHGCVRLPEAIAPLIYEKVKVGTPIEVAAE